MLKSQNELDNIKFIVRKYIFAEINIAHAFLYVCMNTILKIFYFFNVKFNALHGIMYPNF